LGTIKIINIIIFYNPPTPGFVAYTNIQSITNQSINPPNPDCLIASLVEESREDKKDGDTYLGVTKENKKMNEPTIIVVTY
jgi:hypothetical protein